MGNGIMSRNTSQEVVVRANGMGQSSQSSVKKKEMVEGSGGTGTGGFEAESPLRENGVEGEGEPSPEDVWKPNPRTRLPPIQQVHNNKVADGNQPRGVKAGNVISDRLEDLLSQLSSGGMPSVEELRKTISVAANALRVTSGRPSVTSGEECLEAVNDVEVREWLSTTFTHSESTEVPREKAKTPLLMFKAAANSIIISNFLMNFSTGSATDLTMPTGLQDYLEKHISAWDFDVFHVKSLSERSPLRYIGYQLFKTHNLFKKFQIPVNIFDSFMVKIEGSYGHYRNPYHNACHGADVAQTLHYLIDSSGLQELLTDLEIMAMLLAAIIHDVDHPGRSNQFLVLQQSEWALMYHDKSVLENHHLKVAFDYLREESSNFLVNVSVEDYRNIRALVIDMVLATDMAQHFSMVKTLTTQVASPEGGAQLLDKDRHKIMDSLLHLADISHPGKPWRLHHEWSTRICEEFYRQGDVEKEMGCPISPLCDRNNINLPTSQIKFAEIIVSPLFKVGGDMIELLLATAKTQGLLVEVLPCTRVWDRCLSDNMKKWEERRKKEEAFRRPIVPSKRTDSGINRKISLNQVSSTNMRPGELKRKASVDGILLTSKGRSLLNRYCRSSQFMSVPKIMLEHIPDASEQDNSRGSTPTSSASAYDSCSDGTDPTPETPNSLRESSDYSSSSPDSPINTEVKVCGSTQQQQQSSSSFKLPSVNPSSSKPAGGSGSTATLSNMSSSSIKPRPVSGRRKSSFGISTKDKLTPTLLKSPRRSSSPCRMASGNSGRKRRIGMIQNAGN